MNNVTYISASAGSGKTYTLIEKLVKLFMDGLVVPEQVILTTFTVKAASEFKDKLRQSLYEKGLNDIASRIDFAMIGTIHSVANSFIRKYWLYLGLSPDINVMPEEDYTIIKSPQFKVWPCCAVFRITMVDDIIFIITIFFVVVYLYTNRLYNYDFI
jgi:superfamily I DNA/RNA helicase